MHKHTVSGGRMMNLGDGLLFELENGKPRLVLAKYGAESKSSIKKGSYQIPQKKKTLKTTPNFKQGLQTEKPECDKKCKGTTSVSSVEQNITHGTRRTKHKGRTESSCREPDKIQSERKINESCTVTKQTKNLVCLTQEQFQQILSTINSTTSTANDPQSYTEPVASLKENCPTSTVAEALHLHDSNYKHRDAEVKQHITGPLSHGQQSGLFSTFGERERERDALEARRTEWRRELDEQIALKRKQKGQPDTIRDQETAAVVKSSNLTASVQTQRQLPTATRSTFILGEGAPVEDLFIAQRAEQQRRWLQELDQQREEAKLRRQHEKKVNSQAEDTERWAVHFDSIHPASMVASVHREPEGESLGRASLGRVWADTTWGHQQRTSYLRTMTALLDPAQIEERERWKLKQLEHQQAVEAQVEERRHQKEKEEAIRRAHEEEEEKRVERERERLQQQFIKDKEQQRHREELQSRKTEKLYLSIQRAQEEAFKEKHLQRIKDLAKKGHDVSRLLHSLETDSVSQALNDQDSPDTSASAILSEYQIQRGKPSTTTSTRVDTAVQTEVSHLSEVEAVHDPVKKSPNDAVRCVASPNTFTSKNFQHSEEKASERSSGSANMCNAPTKAEAGAYARTSRNRRLQIGKKSEWNMQRPSKAFIMASERYPEAMQRHRQQSRKQRQTEVMTLVEKNTVSKTPQQDPPHIVNNYRSSAQRCRNSAQKQTENQLQEPTAITSESMGHSPSVPAVKNCPQQQSSCQMEDSVQDTGCPPSLDYVPYVRTDEVYHMDPMAPLSRPSTHEAQQRVKAVGSKSRQAIPLVQHDPSHSKSTERQLAILKGLSELRQGLMQKQREIESSFNPLLQTQNKNHFPPF